MNIQLKQIQQYLENLNGINYAEKNPGEISFTADEIHRQKIDQLQAIKLDINNFDYATYNDEIAAQYNELSTTTLEAALKSVRDGQTNESILIETTREKIKALTQEYENLTQFFDVLRTHYEYQFEDITGEELWRTHSGDKYVELMTMINDQLGFYQDKIEALQKIHDHFSTEDNTITVHYFSNHPPGTQQILGFDGTGHLAVNVKRKKVIDNEEKIENEYLSFFAEKKPEPSFFGKLLKRFGVPTYDSTSGKFGSSLAEDMLRFESGYHYKVVLRCDKNLIDDKKLNIDGLLDWIKDKKTPPNKPPAYNFYLYNCSTIVAQGLKIADAEKILGFPFDTDIIAMPGKVFAYVKDLEYANEELLLSKSLATIETNKANVLRRLQYIKKQLNIQKLNFEKNNEQGLDDNQKKEIRKSFQRIQVEIDQFIDRVLKTRNDKEVEDFLNSISHKIFSFINYNHVDSACDYFINHKIKPIFNDLIPFLPEQTTLICDVILKNIRGQFLFTSDNFIVCGNHKKNDECNYAFKKINEQLNNDISNIANAVKQNADPITTLALIGQDIHKLINETIKLKDTYAAVDESISQLLDSHLTNFSLLMVEVNQHLYFDRYNTKETNDRHNLIKRLQYILSLDLTKSYTSFRDLGQAAIISLKDNQPDDNNQCIDNIIRLLSSSQISVTQGMTNAILTYKQSHDKIKEQIYSKLYYSINSVFLSARERNQLHELHVKSQLINALNYFSQGFLSLAEFQLALNDIAIYAPNTARKRAIENFLKSFELQAFTDQVKGGQNEVNLKNINRYNYYDRVKNITTMSNDSLAFYNEFPIHLTDKELIDSSFELIKNSMLPILQQDTYRSHPSNFPDINVVLRAMHKGIARSSTDNANRKLFLAYNTALELSDPASMAYLDIYEGLELLNKILHGSYSYKALMDMLTHYKTSCRTKNGEYLNQINTFQEMLKSVAHTKNYATEMLVQTLDAEYQSLDNIYVFINGLTKQQGTETKIYDNLMSWLSNHVPNTDYDNLANAIKFDLAHFTSRSNIDIKISEMTQEEINTRVSRFKATDSEMLGLINFYPDSLGKYWKDCAPQDHHAKTVMKLIKSKEAYRKIIKSLKNQVLDNDAIIQINREIKNLVDELRSIQIQKNNPKHQPFASSIDMMIQRLQKSSSILNKQIYLESPKIKSLIGDVLGIPNSHKASIDCILKTTEKSVTLEINAYLKRLNKPLTKEQIENIRNNHPKLQLVNIVNKFSIGEISEKEFYHQLKSYIEDHKPRFSFPGLNWIYRMFFKSPIADTYADIPKLKQVSKEFANVYSQLESGRDKQGKIKLSTKQVIQNIKDSTNYQNSQTAAAKEKSIFSFWHKHKRTVSDSLTKTNSLFKKANAKSTVAKDAKVQLKLYHYAKRLG